MEWAILLGLALIAAVLVVLPARSAVARAVDAPANDEVTRLAAERDRLLAELREFDDDAAAGRISADDRSAGRRALAPGLRAVTEALRALGGREDVA